MAGSFTSLYIHLVWGTWDRAPLITPDLEAVIHSAIREKTIELGCDLLGFGAVEEHVHVLIRFTSTVSMALLTKEIKGHSSYKAARNHPGGVFRWQGGYGAFTFRKDDLPVLLDYVHRQKEHHLRGDFFPEWEQTND